MRTVVFVTDHPYLSCSGRVLSHSSLGPEYLTPIKAGFSTCVVVARCRRCGGVSSRCGVMWKPADGAVNYPLGHSHGVVWHVLGGWKTRRALQAVLEVTEAPIALWLRGPSVSMQSAARWATRHGVPYGVEIAGDPADSIVEFLPRGGRAIAPLLRRRFRGIVSRAVAVTSTSESLLREFPNSPGAHAGVVSNVRLDDRWFAAKAKSYPSRLGNALTAVMVSGLVPIKDHVTAIRGASMSQLVARLVIVGDGPEAHRLKRLALQVRGSLCTDFLGHVDSREELAEIISGSDIFVNSSISEGLPRAALEAMARGLPVVASTSSGLRDYIDERMLFHPRSPEALADVLDRLDGATLSRASAENLATARGFDVARLDARKAAIVESLRGTMR